MFLVSLCKNIVPIFIGIARSLGRFSTSDVSFLSQLFPKPPAPKQVVEVCSELQKKKSFTTFRNIVPHNLNSDLKQSTANSLKKTYTPEGR